MAEPLEVTAGQEPISPVQVVIAMLVIVPHVDHLDTDIEIFHRRPGQVRASSWKPAPRREDFLSRSSALNELDAGPLERALDGTGPKADIKRLTYIKWERLSSGTGHKTFVKKDRADADETQITRNCRIGRRSRRQEQRLSRYWLEDGSPRRPQRPVQAMIFVVRDAQSKRNDGSPPLRLWRRFGRLSGPTTRGLVMG